MIILQNSGIPIYQQIANRLKDEILSGKWNDGSFLPSVRGLAQELKISVITTMKAYEILQEEGYITAMQGKGYVVNAKDSEMIMEQQRRKMENALLEAIHTAKQVGVSKEELLQVAETLWMTEE